ncbi:YfjI family protein [Priestia aryabhattai]|uniref:YfjI family protein n=1 Tax=Priestia aryabhattai TaxID=412384 RepID=UPI003CEF0757
MGINPELMAQYEAAKEAKREEIRTPDPFEWSYPVMFEEHALPPFPVEVFPYWLREYVKGVAESTQTPLDAPSIAAVSILSTALAKKFYVRLTGEWSESLNTYTILALPPGNRKSSVFKALQEPVTAFEKEERGKLAREVSEQKAKRKAKQKRVEQLEKEYAKDGSKAKLQEIVALNNEIKEEELKSLPRYVAEDVTPEKLADLMADNSEKMALLSAEGGGIFNIMAGRYAGDGKANLEIFLKGFSGDYCAIDRIGREAKVLNNPALTVGLFIQPNVVQDVPVSFQERGLMPRFLYSFPRSLVGYRKITTQPIQPEVKKQYEKRIKQLMRLEASEAAPLTLNNKAILEEVVLREEIEGMFLEGGALAEMKEWGSKLAGQIIRITGLLHVAEHVQTLPPLQVINKGDIPKQVNETTFNRAKQLTRYFIEHAKAAYGCMGIDEDIQDAKYLLEVIKRQNKPTVAYRDIQLLTNKRFKKASRLRASFFELEERGYVCKRKIGKKTLYEVNPFLLESKKDANVTYNPMQSLSGSESERSVSDSTLDYKSYNIED